MPKSSCTKTEVSEMTDLKFVKLKIPNLIPKELIEEVKGRTFSPDQFIAYQETQKDNPNNHLFVLINSDKKIQGYLWAETNLLDKSLFINTFSVNKQYWGKGEAIKCVIPFLVELKKKTKAPHVFWITTNVKFFEKKGFKRSKNVLMEYQEEIEQK